MLTAEPVLPTNPAMPWPSGMRRIFSSMPSATFVQSSPLYMSSRKTEQRSAPRMLRTSSAMMVSRRSRWVSAAIMRPKRASRDWRFSSSCLRPMTPLDGRGDELGDVQHPSLRIVFAKAAGKLDQTRRRAGHDEARPDGGGVGRLAAQDVLGEVLVHEGEGAGPAAAHVRALHLAEGLARDRLDRAARLLAQSLAVEGAAGIVIRDSALLARGELSRRLSIRLDRVSHARREALGAPPPLRVRRPQEQLGIGLEERDAGGAVPHDRRLP